MALQDIREKNIFALRGSVVDAVNNSVPNYSRSTPIWLLEEVGEKQVLKSTSSYRPVFKGNELDIYLESGGANKIPYSYSLEVDNWIKGSSIQVRPNSVISPRGVRDATNLIWSSGTGNSQLIYTDVNLTSGKPHTLSVLVRANTDNFTVDDKIFIFQEDYTIQNGTGGIISLAELNTLMGKWVRLDTLFVPEGVSENNIVNLPNILNSLDGSYPSFNVTNFGNNTIQVYSPNSNEFTANSLAKAIFSVYKEGITYNFAIASNTALDSQSKTSILTIDTNNSDNLQSSLSINDQGVILNRENQFQVGFYVESINSLDFAVIQLEEKDHPSSLVFQYGQITPKSSISLEYEHNPLKYHTNSAVYFHLAQWEGDGVVLDLGAIVFRIQDRILFVDGLSFSGVNIDDKPSFQLLLEIDNTDLLARLYLDRILLQSITLNSVFVFNLDDGISFSTQGVRVFREVLLFNDIIGDRLNLVGELASRDVELLFTEESILSLDVLNYGVPQLTLPIVKIPPRIKDSLVCQVIGIDLGSSVVKINYSNGLSLIDLVLEGNTTIISPVPIVIQRVVNNGETIIVGYGNLLGISLNIDEYELTLDGIQGIRTGDLLIFNDFSLRATSSVRFPATPIDLQIIQDIDPVNKSVLLGSVSSFYLSRAIILDQNNQDKGEVLIDSINLPSRLLFLSSVDNLSIGDFIYQPKYETIISPYNYFVSLAEEIEGVKIDSTYSNGIIFSNANDYLVTVNPIVKIYM